jgi:hypothetical protein
MLQTTNHEAKRQRVDHLETRRSALAAEHEAATARVTTAQAAREAALANLAEGRGEQRDVEAAERDLTVATASVEHLSAARRSVEAEHAKLSQEVQQHDHEIERARQDEAAAPLRAQADALLALFVQTVAGIGAQLVDRGALALELSRKFPLARRLEPVSFDALAVDLRAALHLDDRVEHREIVAFVRRLLAGPGPAWQPHHADHYFVRER